MSSNKYSNKFAELYKRCMDEFIEQLFSFSEGTLHVTDVTYLDGYFVFDRGLNSITHFHVEECPGWKFGIWWTPVLKDENDPDEFPKFVDAEIFAQYERTIDKFKPSATMISKTTRVDLSLRGSKYYNSNFFDCYSLIKYVRDEPELAYCRNEFYLDYNTEYLSREDAKEKFKKSIDYLNKEDRLQRELDDKVISFVESSILPLFKGSKLRDDGEACYPRYKIMAPRSSVELNIKLCGYYAIEPFLPEETYKQFERCINNAEAKANYENIYWSSSVDMIIQIYNDLEEIENG